MADGTMNKQNMTSAATTAAAVTSMKNISYVAAYFAVTSQLGFVPQTLSLFMILMVFDIITGIYRTYIVEGGNAIQSRIGIKGVLSKMMLLVILFSVAITSKIIGFDPETYVNGAIVVLALGELYSIIGNIHSAHTGKPKSEFDAVTVLLKKLRDILDKYLQV
jgi:toxin secretion/phage lysis holin